MKRIGDGADTRLVELDGLEMAALVEELAGRGVSARFVARGRSMSPWIRDGDVVTVTPQGSSVPAGPGEVAAFKRPGSGRLTVHRLVRRVSEGWEAFLPRGVAGIVSRDLARVLRDMKGFRNVLVHEYGEVNDDLVFLFLTTRTSDFAAFRQGIVEALARHG